LFKLLGKDAEAVAGSGAGAISFLANPGAVSVGSGWVADHLEHLCAGSIYYRIFV
jgi:hypothetical protein